MKGQRESEPVAQPPIREEVQIFLQPGREADETSIGLNMDWETFCDIRDSLKCGSRYAYRDGVLTLEAAPCKVRTGIIASIQSQLDIRGAFGTESALWPRVYPNLGTTLSPRTGYVFRIPDVHIGIESMWNLSHEYDSRLRKYLVVDIDTSNETSNSLRLVDEWFEGGEDIMQVILVHIDKEEAYQITHALNVAANPTQPMTSENIGAKDCGTIWRWGRGSHGHKALIEEIKIMLNEADDYTDIPFTFVDFAVELGLKVPKGKDLLVTLDWNKILADALWD